MIKARVYEWYERFQGGREDVEDNERPSTSTTDENVEKVKEMVMIDRRITIREVADDVGISIGSCHEIFSNVLAMKRVAAKFAPKLLNFKQKQRRMEVSQVSLNEVDNTELPYAFVILYFIFYVKFNTNSLIHFFKKTKIPELIKTRLTLAAATEKVNNEYS